MLGLSCMSVAFRSLAAHGSALPQLIKQFVRHGQVALAAHDSNVGFVSAVVIAAAGDEQAVTLRHTRVGVTLLRTVTAVDGFNTVEAERDKLDDQPLGFFER